MLKIQLDRERENVRKTDEFYRSRLRERSAHEKDRERTMIELINESNRLRDHYREETLRQEQSIRSMPVPVRWVRRRNGDIVVADTTTMPQDSTTANLNDGIIISPQQQPQQQKQQSEHPRNTHGR